MSKRVVQYLRNTYTCPTCGRHIYRECRCGDQATEQWLAQHLPNGLTGEDAYASAREYTPYVDPTRKPKRRGLFG